MYQPSSSTSVQGVERSHRDATAQSSPQSSYGNGGGKSNRDILGVPQTRIQLQRLFQQLDDGRLTADGFRTQLAGLGIIETPEASRMIASSSVSCNFQRLYQALVSGSESMPAGMPAPSSAGPHHPSPYSAQPSESAMSAMPLPMHVGGGAVFGARSPSYSTVQNTALQSNVLQQPAMATAREHSDYHYHHEYSDRAGDQGGLGGHFVEHNARLSKQRQLRVHEQVESGAGMLLRGGGSGIHDGSVSASPPSEVDLASPTLAAARARILSLLPQLDSGGLSKAMFDRQVVLALSGIGSGGMPVQWPLPELEPLLASAPSHGRLNTHAIMATLDRHLRSIAPSSVRDAPPLRALVPSSAVSSFAGGSEHGYSNVARLEHTSNGITATHAASQAPSQLHRALSPRGAHLYAESHPATQLEIMSVPQSRVVNAAATADGGRMTSPLVRPLDRIAPHHSKVVQSPPPFATGWQ